MKSFFDNVTHLIITAVSVILIIFVVLFSNRLGQIDIRVGDVSGEDIYAPRAIVDETTTNAARKAARENVEDVYTPNEDKKIASVKTVNDIFSVASSLRNDEEATKAANAGQLSAQVKIDLSQKSSVALISATDKQFSKMRSTAQIVDSIMSKGVADTAVSVKDCEKELDKLKLPEEQHDACLEIIGEVLTTNLELDEAETLRRADAAASAVPAIEYKKNQIILRKGEVVSQAQLDMLNALGLIKGNNPIIPTYTAGVILIMLLCFIILFLYLPKRDKSKSPYIPIMALVGLISVLIAFYGAKYIPENMLPILPTGIFVCIVTIFAGMRAAAVSNIVLSILCGVAFDSNWGYTVCVILGGLLCAYCFGKVKRRNHLITAAVVSSAMYSLIFFAMSLVVSSGMKAALLSLSCAFFGSILSGILTIGSLPFWEWLFNATTPMKLTELANPENKLLKKLLIEAPGTYHHSLTVANIAEIAAREVNANPLLARVGAYYHDVGKLRHPLYFKENQYDINAHDALTPQESAALITKHITDGVEIAEKYRLPMIICEIIREHHGTTLAGYFYKRAKEQNPDVDENLFRYSGPTPSSKEAAIVMLADSCEAAVRSITDKSKEKVENMVRAVANERVNSGQFAKCSLTFSELETIIKVITTTLGGYFHDRIKYE